VRALAILQKPAARAIRIATDAPEADGTLAWNETTVVLVEIAAAGETGLGYSYASEAARNIVAGPLCNVIAGRDAFDIPRIWVEMVGAVRNLGWRGVCAGAISAVDTALWDLKAKLLRVPLVDLLGAQRDEIEAYGSGGFTSYADARLADQLAGWVEEGGCRAVKMKVGAAPERDCERVRAARAAIGDAELYVDANGAYGRKQALAFARRFADFGVTWFEEPVSSDDLPGLRLMRDRGPPGMDIAAGEYGHEPFYFRRMLERQAVDVLQADITRCGGVSGFLKAAALADAHMTPLSAHTAPALHLHVACAAPRMKNVEWFHDHARIESLLFEGAPKLRNGVIRPDRSAPGHGLTLKEKDAERFAI
jgi:L-alanine-DL-glutamate epimerase-like enolase superfamily enzyme